MIHVTNTPDPNLPNAKENIIYSFEASRSQAIKDKEWSEHLDFVNQHVIGEPLSNVTMSVERLKQMGYVGLYKKETTQ
jgi:hypothetical protein